MTLYANLLGDIINDIQYNDMASTNLKFFCDALTNDKIKDPISRLWKTRNGHVVGTSFDDKVKEYANAG
jgi:hypothetical protein